MRRRFTGLSAQLDKAHRQAKAETNGAPAEPTPPTPAKTITGPMRWEPGPFSEAALTAALRDGWRINQKPQATNEDIARAREVVGLLSAYIESLPVDRRADAAEEIGARLDMKPRAKEVTR